MDKKELGNETNEKIGELNLIALRKYACPKIASQKDWYMKCVECLGLEGCSAGKRAIEILENQTKPGQTQIEKFAERMEKTETSRFKLALETKDPVRYLVDHGYYDTVWRARYALKKYMTRNNLPIAEEILKDHRIKMDPTKTGMPIVDIREFLKGLKTAEEIIEKWLGSGHSVSSYGTLYRQCRRYPDIARDYPVREAASAMQRMYAKAQKEKASGAPNETEATENPGDTDGDEVSIADFLKEASDAGEETEEAPVAKIHALDIMQKEADQLLKSRSRVFENRLAQITEEDYAMAAAQKPAEEPAKAATDEPQVIHEIENPKKVLQYSFTEKRREIERRRLEIKEAILKLGDEMAELERSLKTLDSAAAIFGMRVVDHSQEKQGS